MDDTPSITIDRVSITPVPKPSDDSKSYILSEVNWDCGVTMPDELTTNVPEQRKEIPNVLLFLQNLCGNKFRN
jgi:hypothetical protein